MSHPGFACLVCAVEVVPLPHQRALGCMLIQSIAS